jgi:hypothetical protein
MPDFQVAITYHECDKYLKIELFQIKNGEITW